MPKFCAFCGKPLKNRHQTYCSDKCKYLNSGRRKGLPERKCAKCGQIFYAKDKRYTLCIDCRKARKYEQLCERYASYRKKSDLDDVIKLANECGLSYGYCRAYLDRFGWSPDQLRLRFKKGSDCL